MKHSIQELKKRYRKTFFKNSPRISIRRRRPQNKTSQADLFYCFEEETEIGYQREIYVDYSTGEDYHCYIAMKLREKEAKESTLYRNHSKVFRVSGKPNTEEEKYCHDYCLHRYLSADTLKLLNKEYVNFLLSKEPKTPSIIKKDDQNKAVVVQNYRYQTEPSNPFSVVPSKHQFIVIDGLQTENLLIFMQKSIKSINNQFEHIRNGTRSYSRYSTNLQMVLQMVRPSLDLLWNVDCTFKRFNKSNKRFIATLIVSLRNLMLKLKRRKKFIKSTRVRLNRKRNLFIDKGSNLIRYVSLILTMFFGFIGMINKLQNIEAYRHLLLNLFNAVFSTFEKEIMTYPFDKYYFIE